MKKRIVKLTAIFMSMFLIAALAIPATVAGAESILDSDILSGLAEMFLGNTGGTGANLGSLLSNGTLLTGLFDAVRDKLTTMNYDVSGLTDANLTTALTQAISGMDSMTAMSEIAKLLMGDNSSVIINEMLDILATSVPPMTTDPTEPTQIPAQRDPSSQYQYDPNYNPYYEEPGTVGTDTTNALAPYNPVDYSGYTLPSSEYVYITSPEPSYSETPIYDVVPPATQVADLITTTPYAANVLDDQGDSLNGSSSALKVVLGVALITISLGAVIGVGIMLRKTKA